MALELYANNAATTVPSGGTSAPSGGTQETWTVTSSASFPAASSTVTPATKFHVADPAAPSEVVLVTNVSGTTWTVTRGSESTTPVTHSAGFTVVQVIPAGAMTAITSTVSAVFNVANYGATGNGMLARDGAITASSTTLTSAALVPFAGTRTAWIPGAGVGTGLLQTTITCTVAGTATLGTAASTTVSATTFYWGTDDTAAIQAAIAAASPGAGTVLFPIGNYLISGVLAVTLPNTGSGNDPAKAPSMTGVSGAGFIGDQGPSVTQSATNLIALPTFPAGSFLIDYQQTGTPYGPSGAIVSGLTLDCHVKAAGFRAQGAREFCVRQLTITSPAAPASGVSTADGANGGFSITYLLAGGGNAGAYNLFEQITVWEAGADSFHDTTNSENTYIGCRSAAPVSANYHVGDKGCNTYIDCAYGGGLYGVVIEAAASAKFTNLSIFTGIPWPTKNALLIVGGWQYNLPFYYPPRFTACDFINNPNSGVTEADGAVVRFKAASTYQMGGVFTGCYFGTGNTAFMTDWLYSDTNIGGGAGLGGTVTFRDCIFTGTPATKPYNDQSGIMQFFNCTGVGGIAGGSGGLSPVGGSPHIIAAKTLAAPASSITFSSIPQGYAMLRLVVVGASAAAAESDYFFVRINGDTGSNYDVQYVYGLSSTPGAAQRTATSGWWSPNASFGDMPGANATAASSGILDVEIPGYAATTFRKTAFIRSGFNDSATSLSDQISTSMIATWRNTAAITSLSVLLPSASNFVTGTTALLYAT
jgi:hypothetical protein